MKKGDVLDLQLEKFADRGKSLARLDGYVVFVAGGVPGDRVSARLFKKRKKFGEARLLEVLQPSKLRVEPRCEYFGTCGGCKWQHVDYAAQIEAKREAVRDALVHTGGYDLVARGVEVRPTIGSERIYYYRNKMEFSFSAHRWLTDWEIASGEGFDTDFALGLHVPGRFDKVLDLEACYLQSELSAEIVNSTRHFAKEHEWAPWNVHEQTGYLRHLVIRSPRHTGDLMLNLVTNGHDQERMAMYAEFVRQRFPEVTTLVNTINTSVAQTAFGEATEVVFGPGTVTDKIGRFAFEIGPSAFFQTNTEQAEVLYEVAREMAELRPTDVVYDLYCGAGTISMYLAERASHVVGVELVEEAVDNARENARRNDVDNCTFVAGDMLKLFTPDFIEEHGRPEVLVVDPPRSGMHPKVVARIAELRPERLVYVSCNPQTQARDLQLLGDGFRLESVQPVDLFPHTHHIENVVMLRSTA